MTAKIAMAGDSINTAQAEEWRKIWQTRKINFRES